MKDETFVRFGACIIWTGDSYRSDSSSCTAFLCSGQGEHHDSRYCKFSEFFRRSYEWGDDSQSVLTFAPSFAHFVIPNLAIGMDISLTHISVGDDSYTDLGAGPKVLYAFGKKENSAYPFVSGGVHYLSISNDDSIDGTRFRFGGGVVLLPGRQQHLGITIEVAVSQDSRKGDWEGAESESGTIAEMIVGLAGFVF